MPSPPAPLAPGSLVTGRYRLLRQIGNAKSTLWEAHDDVLARPVAIRSLPTTGTDAVLDAARRAGVVPHRTLTRAYDVVDEPGLRLVVREWVAGEPLDDVVAESPLAPDRAMAVIGSVAEALAAAAAYGVHHGRLHPGHILLTPDGDVRVTDAATAAALVGAPAGDDTGDVQALGCLLYFAVTGRWPGPESGSLPAAPTDEGRLCSPRQVRAGVPRDLDKLIVDCLLWGPTTPASAAEVVSRLTALRHAGERTEQIPLVDTTEPAPVQRSRLPLVIGAGLAVLLVGYVALAALTSGSGNGVPFPDLAALGHRNTTSAAPHTPAGGSAAPSAAVQLTPYPLVSASSFDPPPGDGSEEQSQTGKAIDGDPSTAWFTENYTRADFGGLKKGVGLLLDAGTAVAPTRVQVTFTAPGATYEIRAADTAGPTRDSFPVEGTGDASRSATTTVAISNRTPHRYWLLWLTRLPRATGGYRAGVASITVDH
ncbi:MAG: hypothetical protein QOE76_1391 [Frankiales bacterium]|nr:hypothetical protein [Frankiales bacterium]